MHAESEEGLNAYGAVTWGQFFIYQGFNEKTGWMHTSTYTDVIDEFKETIMDVDGELFYRYGEELRPVKTSQVSLDYKTEGGPQSKTFTMHHTHHGPITHKEDGKAVATAMMWEPAKALEQSFIRTKQNGYKGFREMMTYEQIPLIIQSMQMPKGTLPTSTAILFQNGILNLITLHR